MTVYSYTGSSIDAHVPRDTNTGATTYNAQSWKQGFAAPVLFESFVTDIRSAGDYRLKIDGVVVATVLGVAAAAVGVTFTPAAPIELLPDEYTFSLECTSGAVTWYARGNLGGTSLPAGVGGAGWKVQAWDFWQEPNSGVVVPGQINFKLADQALVSGIDYDSLSSGSFTGQSWSVTFSQDVLLTGVIKRQFASDTYVLSIDGVDVASAVKASPSTQDYALVPATPVAVAAGAHTFRIRPTGGNRRMIYDNGTTSVPSGSGSAYTTAWGNWVEAATNKVSSQIWFRLPLPPGVPTNVAASPDVNDIDLTWDAPVTGDPPTSYEVRINGGAATTATSPHNFGSLTANTTYDLEVRAVNATGASAWVLVQSTTLGPPNVPTSVAGLATSTTSIELTWGPPSGGTPATGYDVRIDGGAPTDVGNVLSHEFMSLAAETIYSLEVRAYNAHGDSAWVEVLVSTSPSPMPEGPTPPDRTYVASPPTTYVIDAEDRTYVIPAEDRTYYIE